MSPSSVPDCFEPTKPTAYEVECVVGSVVELVELTKHVDPTELGMMPDAYARIGARLRGFVLGMWGRPLEDFGDEQPAHEDGYLVGAWLARAEAEGSKRTRQAIADNFAAAAKRLRGKDADTVAERKNLRDFASAIRRREL